MDTTQNTQSKSKRGHRKETPLPLMIRALFFITIGLLIVYIYYLSTEDLLLKQLVKLSSAIITIFKSVPMPFFIIIGYTLLIFYVGYQVGRKKK
ncbi:hypothetical protein [Metabacillus bambusae]|uniref:Uncharacterized protein n=1 Tax=Metabacillus bambusae TaxID=2795218 RepID=A0ABS3N815_9BACI|nr:hypothetical protein [Metabacillus bambusae]MBO1514181.1 hypothetical protein [Metabacillus bambusae]